MTRIICGVDISSSSLEARIGRQGAAASFPNHTDGITALGGFCREHQVELVAVEATGGYEQQALAQLSEAGLPAAGLNPRAVRQFAQSMGRLEKTDRIDAGMIAWYAEVKQSPPVSLAPQSQQHLRAVVTRLRQLTDIRTAQLNQQRLVVDCSVQASFTKLLAWSPARSVIWNSASPSSSSRTHCGANSIRLSAPSRAWPIAPWRV